MSRVRKSNTGATKQRMRTPQVRKAAFAIRHLEQAIDEISARLMAADGADFACLANSLSHAVTALMNAHRALSDLTGGASPMEEALRELAALDFSED